MNTTSENHGNQAAASITVAELIDRICKVGGMTQESLGQLLDVNQSQLSKWRSGTHHPRPEKVLRLQNVLRQIERGDSVDSLRVPGDSVTDDLRREIHDLIDEASPRLVAKIADELRLDELNRRYIQTGRADLLRKALSTPSPAPDESGD